MNNSQEDAAKHEYEELQDKHKRRFAEYIMRINFNFSTSYLF